MPHGGRKVEPDSSIPGTSLSDLTSVHFSPDCHCKDLLLPAPWMVGEMSAALWPMSLLTLQKSQLPPIRVIQPRKLPNLSWPVLTDLQYGMVIIATSFELIGELISQ